MKSKENIRLKHLLVALAICGLSACTDDELDNGPYTPTIGFAPTVSTEWLKGPSAEGRSAADTTTVTTIPLKGGTQPLYLHAVSEPREEVVMDSRGVTTASGNTLNGSMGVSAHINGIGWYMQNVEVTSTSNWTTEYYWPGAQYTGMKFFAYAPYNKDIVSYQVEEPYYELNVADEVANQVDFMVACHLPDEDGNKPMVNVPADKNSPQALKFQHICTAVKFALSNDIAAGKIKSITLKNIKNKGWYLNGVNDADWGGYLSENLQPTGSKDFTISFGNSGLAMQANKGKTIETYKYGDNNTVGEATFYMIPQAFDASASIKVVFEFEEGKEETYEATNLGAWTKGKMITYNISVSPESVGYTFDITPTTLEFKYNGTSENVNQTKFNVESKKTDGTSPSWSIVEYRTRDLTLDETAETTTWKEGTWSNWITTPDGIDWVDLVTSGTEISPVVKSQKPTIIADYIPDFKNKTEQGSESSPVDLSLNSRTTSSTSQNTANCYVVDAPGVYSFPIIYGNVIVDGVVNESAYSSQYTTGTKEDGTTPSANAILSKFVGYDNKPIYDGMTTAQIQADPYISGVASAKLLWQDGHDLVTDIRLSNDGKNVIFNVNKETICDGNAVIAVFNADNEIMWSWHIWVTHYDVSVNTGAIGMNYVPGYTQKIMPYNLGWCEKDERYYDGREIELKIRQAETGAEKTVTIKQNGRGKVKSYMGNNTFYQWGRKDPMRPAVYELDANGNTNVDNHKTIYTTDANYAWDVTSGPTTIANSIKTPYLFYTGDNYWPEAYYINLWNMNVGPTDYADNENLKGNEGKVKSYAVAKTVYDPSPVGYQVPTWNAFYYFTSGFGEGGLNYGSENLKGSKKEEANKFLGVEFESNSTDKIMIWATGSRVAASGTYNGEQSHYWTAYVWCSYDKETNPYANVFQITNTSVTPWIYWIHYSRGCAVRPVTPATAN